MFGGVSTNNWTDKAGKHDKSAVCLDTDVKFWFIPWSGFLFFNISFHVLTSNFRHTVISSGQPQVEHWHVWVADVVGEVLYVLDSINQQPDTEIHAKIVKQMP